MKNSNILIILFSIYWYFRIVNLWLVQKNPELNIKTINKKIFKSIWL